MTSHEYVWVHVYECNRKWCENPETTTHYTAIQQYTAAAITVHNKRQNVNRTTEAGGGRVAK